MGLILAVKVGPFAGQTITLATGQSIVIGRSSSRAQFAVPHDTFMSGAHFAVECGSQGCRVLDKKSSNGTFLNGARIQDAMLANGDEIKSGQTVFAVKIVADDKLPASAPPPAAATPQPAPPARVEPHQQAPALHPIGQAGEAGSAGRPGPTKDSPLNAPSKAPASSPPAPAIPKPAIPPPVRAAGKSLTPAFSVMGWSFLTTPEQWQVQEGFGLQRSAGDEFPSSVVATQEHLGGISLQQFVESQISMLRQYLRDPKIEPAMPPQISGSEETLAVDVRHSTKDGKELVYRRIYARSASSVGVLTVTTLASDLPQILKTLQPLLDSAAFQSAPST